MVAWASSKWRHFCAYFYHHQSSQDTEANLREQKIATGFSSIVTLFANTMMHWSDIISWLSN